MQTVEASAVPSVRGPFTKSGERITFTREQDIDRENRGFTIDKITAMVGGEVVGYIKIENIPGKLARQYYKSIFNYLTQINGSNYLRWDNGAADWRTLPDKDLVTILAYNRYHASRRDEFEGLSRGELVSLIEAKEAKMNAGDQGKQFRSFLNYHVDKPFVAYINVEDYLRCEGIGTALYIEASNWMRERGLVFRSSKCQSDDAQAVWARFVEKGMTRKDENGRFILYPQGGKGKKK